MGEKSYENILIYNIFYKTLIGARPMDIMFDKVDEFIWFEVDEFYEIIWSSKNIMSYIIGLVILQD